MSREIAPMLEQAIRLGLMTRDEAERADAFAEDLAKRHARGEITDEECLAMTTARATADALEARCNRNGPAS